MEKKEKGKVVDDAAFTKHRNNRIMELTKRRLKERKLMEMELAKWGQKMDCGWTSFYTSKGKRLI